LFSEKPVKGKSSLYIFLNLKAKETRCKNGKRILLKRMPLHLKCAKAFE
jgi:hypothetical protein